MSNKDHRHLGPQTNRRRPYDQDAELSIQSIMEGGATRSELTACQRKEITTDCWRDHVSSRT